MKTIVKMKALKLYFFACNMLVICLISLNTSGQVKDNGFVIRGTIKNMDPMPSKLYLDRKDGTRDSAEVKQGKYQFHGTIRQIEMVRMMTAMTFKPGINKVDACSFLLDKGALNIVSDGSVKNAVYSGKAAEAANDYLKATKRTNKAIDTISKIINSEGFKTDPQLSQVVRDRFNKLLTTDMPAEAFEYVTRNPGAPSGPYLVLMLSEIGYPSITKVEGLFNLLPPVGQAAIRESFNGQLNKLRSAQELAGGSMKLHSKMEPGKTAEDFTQSDVNGKSVSLSSFKGKYVLVDFWASWCSPCREEHPNLVKAFNTYKDKGFTILGVSLDSGKSGWLNAISKDGLNWTQVSDLKAFDNEVAKMYGITSIPQNFLVGPDGVIVAANLRGDALEKKLASLLN